MSGPYSKLVSKRTVSKRTVHERTVSTIEKSDGSGSIVGRVPLYRVSFTVVASLATGLLGTVFFAYKWFACLNHLIGRCVFKPWALSIVWSFVLGAGMAALWFNELGLLVIAWLAHVAFAVYLLVQLRKCRAGLPTSIGEKISLAVLCMLWVLVTVLIFFVGGVCLPVCILVETGLIQKLFNTAVYGKFEDRRSLDVKFANDWRLFETVVVWVVVVLSVLLFVWDVSDAVYSVWNLKYASYRGIDFDGKFHLRLFFAEYDPHAGWQLFLWCAASVGVVKRMLKKPFAALFPTVTNRQEGEA